MNETVESEHPRHAVPIQLYYANRVVEARKRMNAAAIPELLPGPAKLGINLPSPTPRRRLSPVRAMRRAHMEVWILFAAAVEETRGRQLRWLNGRAGTDARQAKGHVIHFIKQTVSAFYGVQIEDMVSNRRQKNVASARQIAMYLSIKLTPTTYTRVGSMFGGRDHTTVLHAVQKYRKLIENSPEVAEEIESLIKVICGQELEAKDVA